MIAVDVRISGRLDEMMAAEVRAGEIAVSSAMGRVASQLKAIWRGDIASSGLGSRLAKAVRSEVYPKGQPSLNATALVYTKAPQIIGAHERGALIRAASGVWLAIPTDAAGKAPGGGRVTPGEWQFRTGIRLRFVGRGRTALLVADGARISSRGLAKKKRGKRRRDGILTGETTVVVFTLIRQVKVPKRLNLYAAADAFFAGVPGAIVSGWVSPK